MVRFHFARISVLCVATLLCLAVSAAHGSAPQGSSPRLALVIGNGDYRVGALSNPVNDANLMTNTLTDLGFEVTRHTNLKYFDFGRVIADFGRTLQAAGEDAVGVFYYAGHAIQAKGINYLIPVDVELYDELDLSVKAIRMDLVMQSLNTASNRLNMVFLDSCRNNPFKALTRSTGGGLARIDAPYGTLISYSTAPGAVAYDGKGRNSPYTAALSQSLRAPGLTVEQALKRVRLNVVEKTSGGQIPWESSSLVGDFYFAGQAAPAPRVAALPKEETQQAAPKAEENLRFGPNRAKGYKMGGEVKFADLDLELIYSNVYSGHAHHHFRIYPVDLKVNGTPTKFPYFSVFADYKSASYAPDNLALLRLVVPQSFLQDQASRDADFSSCKGGSRRSASGEITIRLIYFKFDRRGVAQSNSCVLEKMAVRDRLVWAGLLRDLGILLSHADPQNEDVAELTAIYAFAFD